MRKRLLTFGIVGTLMFLGYFFYNFRKSRRFRQSILSAWVAVSIGLTSISPAHAGTGEADAFPSNSVPQRNRPRQNSNVFGGPDGSGGSGSENPDDSGSNGGDDLPQQFPKPESVEQTEERVRNLDAFIRELEESESSATESECEFSKQLQVDESYKSNSDLKKVTKNAYESKQAVKNLEDVKKKLSEGVNPVNIGYKSTNLGNDFYYIRKSDSRIVVKVDPIQLLVTQILLHLVLDQIEKI